MTVKMHNLMYINNKFKIIENLTFNIKYLSKPMQNMFNNLVLILEKQKIQEYTLQNSPRIVNQDNKNCRNQYSKCKSEFMVKIFEKIDICT